METPVTIEALLGQLSDLKGKKDAWRDVAKCLSSIEAHPGFASRFETKAAFLAHAATLTGYTPNALQRMQTTETFVSEVLPRDERFMFDPACGSGGFLASAMLSLSKLEVAKRAYEADRTRGWSLVRDVLGDRVTFRALKDQYDQLFDVPRTAGGDIIVSNPPFGSSTTLDQAFIATQPTARSRAIRSAARQEKTAAEIVRNHLSLFCGTADVGLHVGRYKFDLADPDAVAIGLTGSGIDFVDALDLRALDSHASPSKQRQDVARLSMATRFFRRYWVRFEKNREDFAWFKGALEQLNLNNVGLYIIAEQAPIILKAPHEFGHEAPRAQIIKEILRRGISNE